MNRDGTLPQPSFPPYSAPTSMDKQPVTLAADERVGQELSRLLRMHPGGLSLPDLLGRGFIGKVRVPRTTV